MTKEKFKTIKELEAKIEHLELKDYLDNLQVVDINKARIGALKDVLGLIDKQIKRCKEYIKEQKGFLKLKEMTNKEWFKGRIEECEYTIEMLEELKVSIEGQNDKRKTM